MQEENIHEPLIKQAEKKPSVVPEPVLIAPAPFMSLFKFANSKDWAMMILGSISALGAGTMFPIFVIFFGEITMAFVPDQRDKAAEEGMKIAIKFFVLGGVAFLLNAIGLYCWSTTGARQVLLYKKTYFELLLGQQVAWYDSIDSNQLATQISANIVSIETAISEKMAIIQTMTVTATFGFFYAFFSCWQLSLVLASVLPLLLLAGFLMMKSLMLSTQKNKLSYEEAGGVAEQAIGGIKTIKSLVGEIFQIQRYITALNKSYSKSFRYTLIAALSLGFGIMIFLGIYSLGFWYGKNLILDDPIKFDSAKIIATFFCFVIGGGSIGQISPILKNFGEARVAAAKVLRLINRKKTLIELQQDNGVKIESIESIQLKNVSFAYKKLDHSKNGQQYQQTTEQGQSTSQALKNISIKFEKNKVTALVGESGSGKSTIIQLIMRFYDPTSGELLVNGVPLKELNTEVYRRKIGMVGQEPVLFSLPIKDNLKLANPQATDEQIRQSLQKANILDFLQNSMDMFAGTGGNQLSGGQKQRVAIARAICRNASLLLLDQATSALDKKNERQIQQTLKNVSSNFVTTIVVAHRLSTIKNADNIIVIKKGQIIEQGTHEELWNKKGQYFQLVKSQMSAEQQQFDEIQNREESMKLVDKKILKQGQETKNQIKAPEHSQDKLKGVFRKILHSSKNDLFLYIVGALCCIINGAVFPFYNVALGNVLALMPQLPIKPENGDKINNYCILFAGVAFVGGIATFGYQLSFGIIGERLVYKFRKSIFQKLLRLPISFYDKPYNTPGSITGKMAQDAFQIHNMTTGVIAVVLLNVSTVAISLAFAFYYCWQLTLISLILTPFLVITSVIQMGVIKKMTLKGEASQKSLGSMISDTVCNIKTVKSFGHVNQFSRRFLSNLQSIFDLAAKKALTTAILQGISRAMIMFVEGAMFWIAAVLYQNNYIQNSEAIYISIFSIIFAAMGVGNNSIYMPDLAKAKVAGANIFDIIQAEDQKQISDRQGGTSEAILQGAIQFKDVTFKYPQREQIILDKFNLVIEKGQKIGVVGSSGSGKSTLIQLLMRFYEIESGQILVDGKRIQQYELYSYRRQIGMVSQQPTLFQGSVLHNIKYNRKSSLKTIKKYSEIAYADGFINTWENGYEKQVGQKGSQVSGGQKQRLAIARCLLGKPKIILLDQSTSALDADSEKKVFDNMKQILSKHTSISIAHRLSTIQDANKIIMMRDGKIIQSGSFQELINLKENFYRLAKGIS